MRVDILFETNRFNLSKVKSHFINDCCFGEDLAHWLSQKLKLKNINATDIFQEDWGWGFYVVIENQTYFIGIGGVSDGADNDSNQGEWRVMIEKKRSFVEKILGKNKLTDNENIVTLIKNILNGENDFKNIKTINENY